MKKSTKAVVIDIIASMGAKVNAEGQYEMTQKQFDNLIDEIEANYESDKCWKLAICNNKKDPSIKGVYDESKKNRYAIIKIVANKKKTSKTKKAAKGNEETVRARKEKDNGYVVFFQMENGEVYVDDSMTTCAEIKAFIKDLHHKADKLVMLQIYKMGADYGNNKEDIIETRLSAWR